MFRFDNFPHFPASELSQTLHKIRIKIYQFESFGKLYKNPKYLHIQTLENLYASDHYQLSLQRVTKMLSVRTSMNNTHTYTHTQLHTHNTLR